MEAVDPDQGALQIIGLWNLGAQKLCPVITVNPLTSQQLCVGAVNFPDILQLLAENPPFTHLALSSLQILWRDLTLLKLADKRADIFQKAQLSRASAVNRQLLLHLTDALLQKHLLAVLVHKGFGNAAHLTENPVFQTLKAEHIRAQKPRQAVIGHELPLCPQGKLLRHHQVHLAPAPLQPGADLLINIVTFINMQTAFPADNHSDSHAAPPAQLVLQVALLYHFNIREVLKKSREVTFRYALISEFG